MKPLKTILLSLLVCCLLFSGCKPAKIEKEFEIAETTGARILYTVEQEKNRNAERYTTTVTMMEGVVYHQELKGYYYTADEIKWDDPEYYYGEDLVHCLMWGGVIPLIEADGAVNEYILYSLYDNDLASFFATYCDNNSGEQTTITWHYDTRGYRVIDVYDTELAKKEHLKFWTDLNIDYGVVPPVWEYDMGLTGKLPEIAKGQGRIHKAVIEKMFPDVKPYGTDYPTEN